MLHAPYGCCLYDACACVCAPYPTVCLFAEVAALTSSLLETPRAWTSLAEKKGLKEVVAILEEAEMIEERRTAKSEGRKIKAPKPSAGAGVATAAASSGGGASGGGAKEVSPSAMRWAGALGTIKTAAAAALGSAAAAPSAAQPTTGRGAKEKAGTPPETGRRASKEKAGTSVASASAAAAPAVSQPGTSRGKPPGAAPPPVKQSGSRTAR